MTISRTYRNFPLQDLFRLVRSLSKFGIKWNERNRQVLCLICFDDDERYNSQEERHFCGKYKGSCKANISCRFACSLLFCAHSNTIKFSADFLHHCFLNSFLMASNSPPNKRKRVRDTIASSCVSSAAKENDRELQKYIKEVAQYMIGQIDQVNTPTAFVTSYVNRRNREALNSIRSTPGAVFTCNIINLSFATSSTNIFL